MKTPQEKEKLNQERLVILHRCGDIREMISIVEKIENSSREYILDLLIKEADKLWREQEEMFKIIFK